MKGDELHPVIDELPVPQPSNQTTLELNQGDDVTMITFIAFSSVCILATIVGNVLVVLSIFTYRPLRGVQNYYIVSLACADLAVAVFVMPFNVADSYVGHWQFGAVFCNIWLTFDILMCTASILNLCAIAGDRFFAIHDPLNYAQKRTLRRVLVVIAIVWGASAVISIPPLFGWNNSSSNSSSLYDEINHSCQLTDEPGFVLYSASGSFYIPLVIMAFLYAKIYRATRERLRKRTSASSVRPKSGRRRTGNCGDDSPNPEGFPDHNGSIRLGRMRPDRVGKTDRGAAEKTAEGLGTIAEGGSGAEGNDRTEKGEERGTDTPLLDPKSSLRRDGGPVTADDTRHPQRDSSCTVACDNSNKSIDNVTVRPSETVRNGPREGNSGNAGNAGNSGNSGNSGSIRNTRNGNCTSRDGNGNAGDVNDVTGDGKNHRGLGDGSNKTVEGPQQQRDETLPRRRDDTPATEQPESNGAPSKKTRSRTKNSLKMASSIPRRSSRPLVTVSIVNRANRAQSENWTKTETHLRPMTLKPFRWSSQSSSPDSASIGGSSRLSQILEIRQKISLSKERRAARTMAVVMGAFVLCWLPFFLMYVTFPFCKSCRENTDRRVKNFIVWLGYVNSALNPVIYTIFNIDFRRAFKSLLQGNCRIIA